MGQPTANNYRQKEGAYFKHIMFLKTPLADGRTVLDGYTHALPTDIERWKKKKMNDRVSQMRYLLHRLLTDKPKAFASGGVDRHGRQKKAYDIARFEVWVVNRERGEDAHLCTLVPSSLGGFVPDAELGGFIVGGDELAMYREWILEIFYPQQTKENAWCLAQAERTRWEAREVMSRLLPPTFDEFMGQMQGFIDDVYELYQHRDGIRGAKVALVQEVDAKLHPSWRAAKAVNPEGYAQELSMSSFFTLFYKSFSKQRP